MRRSALTLCVLLSGIVPLPAQVRVHGLIIDSTRMRPLAGARVYAIPTATGGRVQAITDSEGRYEFSSLSLGAWLLDLRHARRDSLGMEVPLVALDLRESGTVRADLGLPSVRTVIASRCGAELEQQGAGIITGTVRLAGDGSPAAEATVHARWSTFIVEGGKLQRDSGSTRVVTGSLGGYHFCGLPEGASIAVQGSRGADSSGTLDVAMPEGRLVVRDIFVAPRQWMVVQLRDTLGDVATTEALAGIARAEGRVVNDRGQPVDGAQVHLSMANRVARTSSTGTFAMDSLPEGTHVLDVRAIGYAPIRAPVNLVRDTPVRETFSLIRLKVLLDTVKVLAERVYSGAQLAGFERRRKMGSGYHMGVEEIERQFLLYPTDALVMMPGVFVRGIGADATVLMRNSRGATCRPNISVDGQLVLTDAFELMSLVSVDRLVGIEVYPRSSFIPLELPMRDHDCGAIAFWTGSRAKPTRGRP